MLTGVESEGAADPNHRADDTASDSASAEGMDHRHKTVTPKTEGTATTTATAKMAVFDPKLYTELLDSCDWTVYIARQEKADKDKRERRALAASEKTEQAQRHFLQAQSQQDAQALAEVKMLAKQHAKEERETRDFERKKTAFFTRQEALLTVLAQRQEGEQLRRDRVKRRLCEKWEQSLLVGNRRPQQQQQRGDDPMVGSGKPSAHTADAFSFSSSAKRRAPTVTAATLRREREEKARHSVPCAGAITDEDWWDGKQGNLEKTAFSYEATGRSPFTTSTLVPQQEKTSATARGQNSANTSRHGKRENDAYFTIQQKEADERAIRQTYVDLAVAYHETAQQSRTGVLGEKGADSDAMGSSMPRGKATNSQLHHSPSSKREDVGQAAARLATAAASAAATATADEWNAEEKNANDGRRCVDPVSPGGTTSAAGAAVFTAIRAIPSNGDSGNPNQASLRRTRVPFTFGPSTAPVQRSSSRCRSSSSNSSSDDKHRQLGLFPFCNTATQDGEKPAMRFTSRAVAGAGAGSDISSSGHVMPLPPLYAPEGGMGRLISSSSQARTDPSERPGDKDDKSYREKRLQIADWEHHRLKDTHISRYMEADGSNKTAFCERKQWEGEMILESQILLM